MRNLTHTRRALAMAALFGTALLGAQATPVNAAAVTCSGYGCDHKDPVDTGCSAGSTVVDKKSTAKGVFELRWSPNCQTNWVRTPGYAGGGQYLKFTVCDYTASGTAFCDSFSTQPTKGLHYGNMVYSRSQNCARGRAYWGSGGANQVLLASSKC
ncbi:DUF2690 domain-containing protein [Streptosporangium sp. KLBMP 9127]|nr:DUF2690 domain-containing protein [Streptosporangium sp. KLBMP 9127]